MHANKFALLITTRPTMKVLFRASWISSVPSDSENPFEVGALSSRNLCTLAFQKVFCSLFQICCDGLTTMKSLCFSGDGRTIKVFMSNGEGLVMDDAPGGLPHNNTAPVQLRNMNGINSPNRSSRILTSAWNLFFLISLTHY